MATLAFSLVVTGLREQVAAAAESIGSVRVALAAQETADGVDRAIPDAGTLFDNVDDLFRCEPVDGAAVRAAEIQGFEIKPTDRYSELVAAIASDRDQYTVRVRHGWPILSLAPRTTTVADAVGVENLDGGGLA